MYSMTLAGPGSASLHASTIFSNHLQWIIYVNCCDGTLYIHLAFRYSTMLVDH